MINNKKAENVLDNIGNKKNEEKYNREPEVKNEVITDESNRNKIAIEDTKYTALPQTVEKKKRQDLQTIGCNSAEIEEFRKKPVSIFKPISGLISKEKENALNNPIDQEFISDTRKRLSNIISTVLENIKSNNKNLISSLKTGLGGLYSEGYFVLNLRVVKASGKKGSKYLKRIFKGISDLPVKTEIDDLCTLKKWLNDKIDKIQAEKPKMEEPENGVDKTL